jgi:hypothetical protein
MPDELEDVIVRTIEDIPRVTLLDAFASWLRRLDTSIEGDGGSFE